MDSASVCGPEGGGFESYQSYVRVHSPDQLPSGLDSIRLIVPSCPSFIVPPQILWSHSFNVLIDCRCVFFLFFASGSHFAVVLRAQWKGWDSTTKLHPLVFEGVTAVT